MRTRLVMALCLVLASLDGRAFALPKYADWARIAVTGQPIAGASIRVIDTRTGASATIYQNAAGTVALSNPFAATAAGYFEFFAANGLYAVSVSSDGVNELYRVPSVILVDPNGAQTMYSSPTEPALTTVQVGADNPCPGGSPASVPWTRYSTTQLRFERRAADGTLADAPWLLDGYRAEQGMNWHYNTYARYANAPERAGFPIADTVGTNLSDAGNFNICGFNIDWHAAGVLEPSTLIGDSAGLWLSPAAGTTTNVDMGVVGAPVAAADVVVLSTTTSGAVTQTSVVGARAPLVVTATQSGRALAAVGGVATVKVTGTVNIGNPLITSSTPGYAKAGPIGSAAPTTLGSALTASSGGTGTVRVRVGMVRTP